METRSDTSANSLFENFKSPMEELLKSLKSDNNTTTTFKAPTANIKEEYEKTLQSILGDDLHIEMKTFEKIIIDTMGGFKEDQNKGLRSIAYYETDDERYFAFSYNNLKINKAILFAKTLGYSDNQIENYNTNSSFIISVKYMFEALLPVFKKIMDEIRAEQSLLADPNNVSTMKYTIEKHTQIEEDTIQSKFEFEKSAVELLKNSAQAILKKVKEKHASNADLFLLSHALLEMIKKYEYPGDDQKKRVRSILLLNDLEKIHLLIQKISHESIKNCQVDKELQSLEENIAFFYKKNRSKDTQSIIELIDILNKSQNKSEQSEQFEISKIFLTLAKCEENASKDILFKFIQHDHPTKITFSFSNISKSSADNLFIFFKSIDKFATLTERDDDLSTLKALEPHSNARKQKTYFIKLDGIALSQNKDFQKIVQTTGILPTIKPIPVAPQNSKTASSEIYDFEKEAKKILTPYNISVDCGIIDYVINVYAGLQDSNPQIYNIKNENYNRLKLGTHGKYHVYQPKTTLAIELLKIYHYVGQKFLRSRVNESLYFYGHECDYDNKNVLGKILDDLRNWLTENALSETAVFKKYVTVSRYSLAKDVIKLIITEAENLISLIRNENENNNNNYYYIDLYVKLHALISMQKETNFDDFFTAHFSDFFQGKNYSDCENQSIKASLANLNKLTTKYKEVSCYESTKKIKKMFDDLEFLTSNILSSERYCDIIEDTILKLAEIKDVKLDPDKSLFQIKSDESTCITLELRNLSKENVATLLRYFQTMMGENSVTLIPTVEKDNSIFEIDGDSFHGKIYPLLVNQLNELSSAVDILHHQDVALNTEILVRIKDIRSFYVGKINVKLNDAIESVKIALLAADPNSEISNLKRHSETFKELLPKDLKDNSKEIVKTITELSILSEKLEDYIALLETKNNIEGLNADAEKTYFSYSRFFPGPKLKLVGDVDELNDVEVEEVKKDSTQSVTWGWGF